MKLLSQTFAIEAGKFSNRNINSYPYLHDLAFSASIILQAKIIEDLENKAEHLKSAHDLFFDSKHLISYSSSLPNNYPTSEKLYKFIYSLYQYHNFGAECCICMLFYALKFLKESKIPLFKKNWKKIIITATLISQKVTNENHISNYEFGLFFDDLSDYVLYEMEKDYLNVLHLSYEIDEQKYEAVFDIVKSVFDSSPSWEIDYDSINKIVERSKELTREIREMKDEDELMIRRVDAMVLDDYAFEEYL